MNPSASEAPPPRRTRKSNPAKKPAGGTAKPAVNRAARPAKDVLEYLLDSRARASVLRILFGDELPDLCIAEIAERVGMAAQGVDEQLRRLAEMRLLRSRTDRSRRYYRADPEHPAFSGIRALVAAVPEQTSA